MDIHITEVIPSAMEEKVVNLIVQKKKNLAERWTLTVDYKEESIWLNIGLREKIRWRGDQTKKNRW